MIAATALIFSDASRPRDGTDNPARRAHDARPEGGHPHAIRHRRRVDNGLVVAQVAVDSERSTPFSHVAESSRDLGRSAPKRLDEGEHMQLLGGYLGGPLHDR
jgi:hypothetical protein